MIISPNGVLIKSVVKPAINFTRVAESSMRDDCARERERWLAEIGRVWPAFHNVRKPLDTGRESMKPYGDVT